MSKTPCLMLLIRTAVLLVVLLPAGCDSQPSDERPLVLTTIGMIADVTSRIATDHVRVEALMGPGVDPHLYKTSEGDIRRLSRATLVLFNGLHLEGKMADVLGKMGRERPVVAVTDAIPREALRAPPEFAGQYDPHVWFDVSLWSLTVERIAAELQKIDPPHATDIAANAAALRSELEALDQWVTQRIAEIPENRRVLVTAHDAFGYFGRRYGIEVVGLQGISTVAEAGIQDVERLVELIVRRRVPAIFVESSVPRRAIEAVQSACRARGHEVAIGGQLFSDAMGAAGTPEGTYAGMVRYNVNTIVEALK
ncbi:MAG: zinc ABC transporter substrate-binding protein [Planctomycetota bacterium]